MTSVTQGFSPDASALPAATVREHGERSEKG